MIFRRSLVRELTATAIGLFVVLLGILFTNLVLESAGPGGRRRRRSGGHPGPARLQRDVLFQHPAVGDGVPDRAPHPVALVPGQRDDRLVYLRPGADRRCSGRSCWFAAPFFLAIVVLSLFLSPWAEQRRIEYERQLESKDELALVMPGLFREFRRANLVVYVDSINTFDGHDPQRLPAFDRGRQGRDDGGAPGAARGGAQRRPVHHPDRRPALRRQARNGRIPGRRIREARAADRAGGAPRPSGVDQGDSDLGAACSPTGGWSAPSSSGDCPYRSRRSSSPCSRFRCRT